MTRHRWVVVGWFLIGCMATALVVGAGNVLLGGAATTQAVRDHQKTNTATLATNTEILDNLRMLSRRIVSCTTPGRPCSNRAQRQAATYILGLKANGQQSAAAAASCAVTLPNPTYPAVLRCELRTIARGSGH